MKNPSETESSIKTPSLKKEHNNPTPLPYKIKHGDLIYLANLLGYENIRRGLCNGFTLMLLQAMLDNQEENFFKILTFIASYQKSDCPWDLPVSFKTLVNDIEDTRKKVVTRKILDEQDNARLQVIALFDGIELFQNPGNHPELFNQFNVLQTDYNILYSFRHVETSETVNLHRIFDHSYLFNRETLSSYLLHLSTVLKKLSYKLPIVMCSQAHILLVTYDIKYNHWVYVDTNDFTRYAANPSYFRLLNHAEMVDSLFISFDSSNLLLLQTIVISNQKSDIQQWAPFWDSLSESYALTSEQVLMENSEGMGLLHLACRSKNLPLVQKVLQTDKVDINKAITSSGSTPLIMAADASASEIVEELMKQKELDINQLTSGGHSALWFAVANNASDIIDLFLNRNDLLINAGVAGYGPLHLACELNQVETLRKFLSRSDTDVNQLKNGRFSPLALASEKGHDELVRLLLADPRIDVNEKHELGCSLFWKVCALGKLKVVEAFLNCKGLRLNDAPEEGNTPFYVACGEGNLPVAQELLKYKVGINQPCKGDLTPLGAACRRGALPLVEELLKRPELEINGAAENGLTGFDLACLSWRTDIAKRLLETGVVDVNRVDKKGNTALHNACRLSYNFNDSIDTALLEFLLENRANILLKNHKDQTPFDIALATKNKIALLVLSKFIVNQKLDPKLLMSNQSWEVLLGEKTEVSERLKTLMSESRADVSFSAEWNTPHFFSNSPAHCKNDTEDLSKEKSVITANKFS
ncbi:MAG: ankyrin repeat domain-containing protein [Legionella sp.]|nr:ankyrin repeat domain-containing protein [Legionella sp.]